MNITHEIMVVCLVARKAARTDRKSDPILADEWEQQMVGNWDRRKVSCPAVLKGGYLAAATALRVGNISCKNKVANELNVYE